MRDGPLRVVLKTVTRWVRTVDLRVTRAVQAAPRYRLSGACNGCGRCCEAPTMQVGRVTWFLPTARRLFLWWQREINGFELVEPDARLRAFVFRCTHFDPATKQCDSYDSRPLMCRDYPLPLLAAAVPPLFPECSYRVHDTKAVGLRAALRASGLSGAKLAEVEKKLFLEDEKDER